jgi:S-(hydroxymethyl)glutathione dehydrogenase/alcohol dehydrogenase
MRAAVFSGVGRPMGVEDLLLDGPKAHEVRVRVAACGVCHSDLRVVEGAWEPPAPLVLGHEGAGIVVEVGAEVTDVAVGDHVITAWASSCGGCHECRSGRPWLCDAAAAMADSGCLADGTCRLGRHDGSRVHHFLASSLFAEEAVLPASGVVKICDDAPLESVCIIGCAVATGFGAVVNTAQAEAGSTVAVLGLGAVGLAAVQGARHRSAGRVIAVDVKESRLDLARRFGATDVVNAARDDPVGAVRDLTGGVDHAIECAGLSVTQEQAVAMLRARGTAVMVGLLSSADRPCFDTAALTCREQRIVGSYFGSSVPERDLPALVDLYLQGGLMVDEMISRRRPLDELQLAFDDLAAGIGIRTVIIPA